MESLKLQSELRWWQWITNTGWKGTEIMEYKYGWIYEIQSTGKGQISAKVFSRM